MKEEIPLATVRHRRLWSALSAAARRHEQMVAFLESFEREVRCLP